MFEHICKGWASLAQPAQPLLRARVGVPRGILPEFTFRGSRLGQVGPSPRGCRSLVLRWSDAQPVPASASFRREARRDRGDSERVRGKVKDCGPVAGWIPIGRLHRELDVIPGDLRLNHWWSEKVTTAPSCRSAVDLVDRSLASSAGQVCKSMTTPPEVGGAGPPCRAALTHWETTPLSCEEEDGHVRFR
jgi:hypothetical protein